MIPFHQTPMGRTFFERNVPEFVVQVKRLGNAVEHLCELLERAPRPEGAPTPTQEVAR